MEIFSDYYIWFKRYWKEYAWERSSEVSLSARNYDYGK